MVAEQERKGIIMKKILDFLRDFLPPLMCPGGSILPLKIYFIYLYGWGLLNSL